MYTMSDTEREEEEELDSAQTKQNKVGEASSDPKTTGPTENLREKAANMTDESEDSEEPA
jgi:hypothetical protein